jgi:hypothetical protein
MRVEGRGPNVEVWILKGLSEEERFSTKPAADSQNSILWVIQYPDCIELKVVTGCESGHDDVISPREHILDFPDASQRMPLEIDFSFLLRWTICRGHILDFCE